MTERKTADSETVVCALDALQSRLSQPLSLDERAAIAAHLIEAGERHVRLRAFALENGEQPAPGFHPFRQGGRAS